MPFYLFLFNFFNLNFELPVYEMCSIIKFLPKKNPYPYHMHHMSIFYIFTCLMCWIFHKKRHLRW